MQIVITALIIVLLLWSTTNGYHVRTFYPWVFTAIGILFLTVPVLCLPVTVSVGSPLILAACGIAAIAGGEAIRG